MFNEKLVMKMTTAICNQVNYSYSKDEKKAEFVKHEPYYRDIAIAALKSIEDDIAYLAD